MRTQQFQGDETGQLRALAGLDQWQVFFFQGNAWSNCQSTGIALPSGVRLVARLRPRQRPGRQPGPRHPDARALSSLNGSDANVPLAPGAGERARSRPGPRLRVSAARPC